jgi:hypothetical protein
MAGCFFSAGILQLRNTAQTEIGLNPSNAANAIVAVRVFRKSLD